MKTSDFAGIGKIKIDKSSDSISVGGETRILRNYGSPDVPGP